MLVVDVYALLSVNLLDFIDQERLECILTEDGQNVMRILRTVTERLCGDDRISVTHQDVGAHRNHVPELLAEGVDDIDDPLTLGDRTDFNGTGNLGKHCGILRSSGLEELTDTGKTTGDILCLE